MTCNDSFPELGTRGAWDFLPILGEKKASLRYQEASFCFGSIQLREEGFFYFTLQIGCFFGA